ncbi:MAG: L-histidine N(alpha)-methyltransferase [Chryseosolibacter sp.]
MVQSKTTFNQPIAEAVAQGFSGKQKTLPSWLFYDETGDRIFQQIMRMPEYYPTRCEYDILQQHKDDLLQHFTGNGGSFRLIELGAGDGIKTEILLKHFMAHGSPFTYLPIDISANALEQLSARLQRALPGLRIQPLNQSYDEALKSLHDHDDKKVILFMGANIGNFTLQNAAQFLKKIAAHLSEEDLVLIGFDLKKDPRIIHEAYDDPHGLTSSFNLNILTRLNRELGAEFNPAEFSHYPYYDPQTGTTKSFLISLKEQDVPIASLGGSVHFDLWETIQTEISQKYDLDMIEQLMATTGLKVADIFYDNDNYFCDVLVKLA